MTESMQQFQYYIVEDAEQNPDESVQVEARLNEKEVLSNSNIRDDERDTIANNFKEEDKILETIKYLDEIDSLQNSVDDGSHRLNEGNSTRSTSKHKKRNHSHKKKTSFSRALPSTTVARKIGKPPFHIYGSRNIKPTDGGIMYGDYMKTHSVKPDQGPSKPEFSQVLAVITLKSMIPLYLSHFCITLFYR